MSGLNSNKFAIYVAGGRILAMMAQFIMPVFLTHYLSESDYGLYAQFYLLLTFISTILCFGLQSNLFYFYPNSSRSKCSYLVWNNLILMSLLGIIGVCFLSIPFFRHILLGDSEIEAYWNIITLCIVFYIPTNLISTISIVANDKLLATFYPPTDVVLKILIIIPITLIFNSMTAIFCGVLLLQILLCGFVFFYVVRKYGNFINIRCGNVSLIKEQLAYALPFGGAVLINTICQRLDKIVSISYLTEAEYAVYSLAFFGIPGIMQIYDSITQVNVMNMSAAYSKNQKSDVISLYRNFVQQTLSFSLPLILIVFLFAPQFIEFAFSIKYIDTVPYFRIYILTFIIAMIGCGTILRAVGLTKQSLYAYIISCIVYIPCCFIMIRHYGINGAMISAVIGAVLPRIIQFIFELRWARVPIVEILPVKNISIIVVISVILLLPIAIINYYFDLNVIYSIFFTGLYILSVYVLELKYDVFTVNRISVYSKLVKIKGFVSKR